MRINRKLGLGAAALFVILVILTIITLSLRTSKDSSADTGPVKIEVTRVPKSALNFISPDGGIMVWTGGYQPQAVTSDSNLVFTEVSQFLATINPRTSFWSGSEVTTTVVYWSTMDPWLSMLDNPPVTNHPAVGSKGIEAAVVDNSTVILKDGRSWVFPEGKIQHLAFGENDQLVVTEDRGKLQVVHIWDLGFGTNEPKAVFTSTQSIQQINNAELKPDRNLVFSAKKDGVYDVFEIESWGLMYGGAKEPRQIPKRLHARFPSVGPNGEIAFVVCQDQKNQWQYDVCKNTTVFVLENGVPKAIAKGTAPSWRWENRMSQNIWVPTPTPIPPTPTLTPTPAPTMASTATPWPTYAAPQAWPTPPPSFETKTVAGAPSGKLNFHKASIDPEWRLAPDGQGPNGEGCATIPNGQTVEVLPWDAVPTPYPFQSSYELTKVRWGSCEGYVRPQYLK